MRTERTVLGMQWAAVRIARWEMTVPEHAPDGELNSSRMFRRTTAEAPVGHSVPLRISSDAVDPSVPHAPPAGRPGEGVGVVGVVGVPPPPPPQPIATARQNITV